MVKSLPLLGLAGLSAASASAPCDKRAESWQPAVGETWQIVLENKLDMSSIGSSITPDVAIFDIDLFDSTNDGADPDTVIGALHDMGKKVICYFSAGTFEPGRPDSDQYTAADKGAVLPDWPDEKWVDVRSENVRDIVKNRIALAADMGCDGIDPDNMDGFSNQNGGGFSPALTKQDAIDFLAIMTEQAASKGMAIGLKNALQIVTPELVSTIQFAVNEECASYTECGVLQDFIDAGKPVFHIEYPEPENPDRETGWGVAKRKKHCEADDTDGFSTLLKTYDLDGWVQFCDGTIAETPMLD